MQVRAPKTSIYMELLYTIQTSEQRLSSCLSVLSVWWKAEQEIQITKSFLLKFNFEYKIIFFGAQDKIAQLNPKL